MTRKRKIELDYKKKTKKAKKIHSNLEQSEHPSSTLASPNFPLLNLPLANLGKVIDYLDPDSLTSFWQSIENIDGLKDDISNIKLIELICDAAENKIYLSELQKFLDQNNSHGKMVFTQIITRVIKNLNKNYLVATEIKSIKNWSLFSLICFLNPSIFPHLGTADQKIFQGIFSSLKNKWGVDINYVNDINLSVLMMAILAKNEALLTWLLANEVKLDYATPQGKNALIIALEMAKGKTNETIEKRMATTLLTACSLPSSTFQLILDTIGFLCENKIPTLPDTVKMLDSLKKLIINGKLSQSNLIEFFKSFFFSPDFALALAHTNALIYLMTKRNPFFSVNASIEIVQSLDIEQANLIAQGTDFGQVKALKPIIVEALLLFESLKDNDDLKYDANNILNSLIHSVDAPHAIARVKALVTLVKKQNNMSEVETLRIKILNLTQPQALGIVNGLEIEDVTSLDDIAVETLQELKVHGLTRDHIMELRGPNINTINLSMDYKMTLIYLMTTRKPRMNASTAVNTLKTLSLEETQGLRAGLSKEEVVGLNPNLIHMLMLLKPFGFRVSHLSPTLYKHFNSPEPKIKSQDRCHFEDALIYLTSKANPPLAPKAAVELVKDLTYYQARGITLNLRQDEVIHLKSMEAITSAAKLKSHGLSTDQIKQITDRLNSPDSCLFTDVLVQLKQKHLFNADKISELSKLTFPQLIGISKGLVPNEVTLFQNEFIIEYLVKLKPFGMTAETYSKFINSIPSTSSIFSYSESLLYLVKKKLSALSPSDATEILLKLNPVQAESLRQGVDLDIVQKLETQIAIDIYRKYNSDLTCEHLTHLNKEFSVSHAFYFKEALIYLTTKAQPLLSIVEAIDVLKGLNGEQTKVISKGLKREEVIKCKNEASVNALITLNNQKLPSHIVAEILSLINSSPTQPYVEAFLTLQKASPNLSPEQIVEQLKILSLSELGGIINGLSPNEVTELNAQAINALVRLIPLGLTLVQIKDFSALSLENSNCYVDAIVYLMKKAAPPLNANQAFDLLNDLTPAQAQGIAEGLSKTDVIELSPLFNYFIPFNKWAELKNNQFTNQQLLMLRTSFTSVDGNEFVRALIHLRTRKSPFPMTTDDAVTTLLALKFSFQAAGIAGGLTLGEVLAFKNELMMSTFLTLKNKGVTIEHILLLEEKFSLAIPRNFFPDALDYLIANTKLSASESVKILLRVQLPYQAKGIAQGLALEEVLKFRTELLMDTFLKFKNDGLTIEETASLDRTFYLLGKEDSTNFLRALVHLTTRMKNPLPLSESIKLIKSITTATQLQEILPKRERPKNTSEEKSGAWSRSDEVTFFQTSSKKPSSPKFIRSTTKDAADTHWYDSDEMEKLLQNAFKNNPEVYLFHPLNNIQYNLLKASLLQYKNLNLNNRQLVIPINLNGLHWVAVHILFDEDGLPIIKYLDPFGSGSAPEIVAQLKDVFPNFSPKSTFQSSKVLQRDTYNCGPWVVAILTSLAQTGNLPNEKFDITTEREIQQTILEELKQGQSLKS